MEGKADKYLYWLDSIESLGRRAKLRLLEAFGTPYDIYHAGEHYLKYVLDEKRLGLVLAGKRSADIDRKYEMLLEKGIRMTTVVNEDFPEKLREIPDPPFSLYYLGKLPSEILPSVAVIGARECSEYGRYIARELGRILGVHGIQVISGMARGIDGISQSAALEAGSYSYGIMGCGVDICYPKSNQDLYRKLQKQGGILSTYPPGTQPMSKLFPPRNRIVSGLADVLVVIEARQKSGTSITVEMALEQGRDIYAVPGRITDRLSDGCNKMLKEGAHVFLSPQDFIQDLYQLLPVKMANIRKKIFGKEEIDDGQAGSSETGKIQSDMAQTDKIPSDQEQLANCIMEVLDFYPLHVDAIAGLLSDRFAVSVPVVELNVVLMQMCLFENIEQNSPGWFSKSR